MDMKSLFNSKKAISGVITAIIMIGLVMATTVIVWNVINKLVKEELGSSKACFGVFDKIKINNFYTCYNSSSSELKFSINVGDIDVDELLVSISGPEQSKSFKLSSTEPVAENYIRLSSGEDVKLPGKNAGLSYIFNASEIRTPGIIKIAPIIDGNQCDVSDTLSEIDSCSELSS